MSLGSVWWKQKSQKGLEQGFWWSYLQHPGQRECSPLVDTNSKDLEQSDASLSSEEGELCMEEELLVMTMQTCLFPKEVFPTLFPKVFCILRVSCSKKQLEEPDPSRLAGSAGAFPHVGTPSLGLPISSFFTRGFPTTYSWFSWQSIYKHNYQFGHSSSTLLPFLSICTLVEVSLFPSTHAFINEDFQGKKLVSLVGLSAASLHFPFFLFFLKALKYQYIKFCNKRLSRFFEFSAFIFSFF